MAEKVVKKPCAQYELRVGEIPWTDVGGCARCGHQIWAHPAPKKHPRAACGHRWYPVSGAMKLKTAEAQVMIACPMCFKYTYATFEYLGYNLSHEQADVLRQRKKLRK
jgi:hypothetical protein